MLPGLCPLKPIPDRDRSGLELANPNTNRPYHPTEIQKRHLRPSGCCIEACPTCGATSGVWCRQDQPTPNGARLLIHEARRIADGRYGAFGWHTFRHTYRSWVDETGAPMKVQQELMRHASIPTTMSVYRYPAEMFWGLG